MTADSDRRLASLFGVVAAALLLLDAALRFLIGVVFLATGRELQALGSVNEAVVFVVLGLVIGFISVMGRTRAHDRSVVVGAILIVLAIVGWLVLGFSDSLLALLASVFTLIAGILYLVAAR